MSRLPPERLAAALDQQQRISAEDHSRLLAAIGIIRPMRSFLFKTPDDHGLKGWEDVYFPSDDGTPLEGWYIPATGGESDRLIIFNHASPMCRAGFPGHLGPPWSLIDTAEIDFVLQMKHLADAGYNILAYDLRNHGNSSAANGGITGIGLWEWRDCVGAKSYVDSHPRLSRMTVGLYSQCLGGNAQYAAMHFRPDQFANIACMVSPMVVSFEALMSVMAERLGIGAYRDLLDLELLKAGSFTMAEMTPHLWAPSVTVPLLMIQLLHDSATRNPEDAQATFDLVASEEKELFWIEDTTHRFRDGYNYFGRHPEKIITFFDRHMKQG